MAWHANETERKGNGKFFVGCLGSAVSRVFGNQFFCDEEKGGHIYIRRKRVNVIGGEEISSMF